MDRVDEVMEVINRDIADKEKINILQNLLLDLKNELEAQDQNMHPEIRTRLSEAYRLANQYLIELG